MISSHVIKELQTVRNLQHYLPTAPRSEGGWSSQEEDRFWEALELFPQGPWTYIAEHIGTRSTRQAMTRGQKLRQKLMRWRDRLQSLPTTAGMAEELVATDHNVERWQYQENHRSDFAVNAQGEGITANSATPVEMDTHVGREREFERKCADLTLSPSSGALMDELEDAQDVFSIAPIQNSDPIFALTSLPHDELHELLSVLQDD